MIPSLIRNTHSCFLSLSSWDLTLIIICYFWGFFVFFLLRCSHIHSHISCKCTPEKERRNEWLGMCYNPAPNRIINIYIFIFFYTFVKEKYFFACLLCVFKFSLLDFSIYLCIYTHANTSNLNHLLQYEVN